MTVTLYSSKVDFILLETIDVSNQLEKGGNKVLRNSGKAV